jgi:predicted  nucleic acid-binding Zn-ribbon protein
MVLLESEEKALKAAEAQLKIEAVEVEKEKAEARTRTAEDEKLLAEFAAKRTELRSGVNDSALAHYDRVLRARKSVVVEARGQKCMACFVLIRPQTWEEIRTNEQIVTCSSCGRMLFYDPTREPPPAADPPKKKAKKQPVEAESETEVPTEAAPTS